MKFRHLAASLFFVAVSVPTKDVDTKTLCLVLVLSHVFLPHSLILHLINVVAVTVALQYVLSLIQPERVSIYWSLLADGVGPLLMFVVTSRWGVDWRNILR